MHSLQFDLIWGAITVDVVCSISLFTKTLGVSGLRAIFVITFKHDPSGTKHAFSWYSTLLWMETGQICLVSYFAGNTTLSACQVPGRVVRGVCSSNLDLKELSLVYQNVQ